MKLLALFAVIGCSICIKELFFIIKILILTIDCNSNGQDLVPQTPHASPSYFIQRRHQGALELHHDQKARGAYVQNRL